MSALSAILVTFLVAVPVPATVTQILESVPPDRLDAPLTRFEATHRGTASAEAALMLGRVHYARGEYAQAAESFMRATPRFGPARRAETRYWAGMSWLGARQFGPARAAFQESARAGSPRRAEALLGVALCWEAARRPDRALQALQTLLGGDPGEVGPTALEHLASLAGTLRRPDLVRQAHERLCRDYPRSVEAMRAGPAPAMRHRTPARRHEPRP